MIPDRSHFVSTDLGKKSHVGEALTTEFIADMSRTRHEHLWTPSKDIVGSGGNI